MDLDSVAIRVAVVCLNSDHWITVAILGVRLNDMLVYVNALFHVFPLGSNGSGELPLPVVYDFATLIEGFVRL